MIACVESFERLLGIASKAGGGLGFPLEPDAWTAQHLITSLQSIKEGEGSGCRMPGSAQLLNYCIYFSKQQLTSSAALQRGAYRYFLSLSLSLSCFQDNNSTSHYVQCSTGTSTRKKGAD